MHANIPLSPSVSCYFKRLSFLLLGKALLSVAVILFAGIELGPDEAQYWTWSQQLDWGYYSKPPGIAWLIWLGTHIWGQTEMGVRFPSLILSMAQSLVVYFLALRSGLQARTAFWSGVLMAFCPLGVMGSFLAITDGGFLLFWTLACLVVASALQQAREANPFLVGGCLLGGALFKWPIYIFWIFFFLCRQSWFPKLSWSKSLGGVALSLFGLFPSIWWNRSHDWATFRHVFSTLQGGHGARGGNVLDFLGSQAALLSPLLFLLLLVSLASWLKRRSTLSAPLLFCGGVSFFCLLTGTFLSFFQKIQGNWIVFAYPTGFVFTSWFVCEGRSIRVLWLKVGVLSSLCLTLCVLLLPRLYPAPIWRPSFVSYRLNPFKHNVGWTSLKAALTHYGYDPQTAFLFSDKYQTTSVLSFYGEGQKRAYFFNLQGMRKNQFSYWPSIAEEQKGKIGYFVWTENHPHLERDWQAKLAFYQAELNKYFECVELLGMAPLFYDQKKMVKGAVIFKCGPCRDNHLLDSSLY